MGCWGWQVEYHKSAQPWACTWGPSAEGRDSSPHQSQSLTVQSSGPTVKEQLLLQVEAEACLEKKVSCCAPFHCANFCSCGKATSCHQAADFHSVWKVGNDTSNPQRMGKMKLHLNSCCEGQQWLYTTGSPQGGTSCAWMLPAFSSGEGNSQCPPISTHRWTPASHGCSESGVTLPAGCTNNSVLWSQSRGTEGQHSPVCLCPRLCSKALPRFNDIVPGAKLLKVSGPQHQKKPGEDSCLESTSLPEDLYSCLNVHETYENWEQLLKKREMSVNNKVISSM